jgi:hypothetical protein
MAEIILLPQFEETETENGRQVSRDSHGEWKAIIYPNPPAGEGWTKWKWSPETTVWRRPKPTTDSDTRSKRKMTEKPKLDHSSWPEHIRRNIREGYEAPDLALKARFEVDNLLRFTAATNPALSPGICRRLVVNALRAELDRIQAWNTWDDPILPADNAAAMERKEKLT